MNLATLMGVVCGFGVLAWATYASSPNTAVFLNLPGLAIVFGGTMGASLVCYPMKDVAAMVRAFFLALKRPELPVAQFVNELGGLARAASTQGVISLEKEVASIENDFLRDAVQMLVDGYSREEIEEVLNTRIEQTYEREMAGAQIFRTMARLSPAFGIVGTLIGLINMLQSLGSNLRQIGPALAVALTTTLYGVLAAHMIFLPVAVKVESRIEERVALMSLIRDGVLFIKDKAPAAVVLNKLNAYLPARRWAKIRKQAG